MTKTKIECSHCVLGTSYSATIASHLLKVKGIDTVNLGLTNDHAILNLILSKGKISPIPIFPVLNSSLFKTLKFGDSYPQTIIEVSHTELKNCNIADFTIQPGSLAEFLYKDTSDLKAFALSYKHWGSAILSQPFSEIQKKITRHYLSATNNARVGFFDGFTLYNHFIRNNQPNIVKIKLIEKIDYKNKIIHTDNLEIRYNKLISTIPINILFRLCRLEIQDPLIYEGSFFFYFSHSSDFSANKIIYDYDLMSNISRIFSPTDNIIMVQLLSYKKGRIKIAEISKRLMQLIPSLKEVKFEKELYLTMSYPLESITNLNTLDVIKVLNENSVLLFGRFGRWEYKDLHELNWESIV